MPVNRLFRSVPVFSSNYFWTLACYVDFSMQYFGLREDQVPLIIIQDKQGKKYLKQNLDSLQIAPWIKEFMVTVV